MADQLIIRPVTGVISAESQVDWFLYNQQGMLLDKSCCSLDAVHSAFPVLDDISLTVIVPSTFTFLTRVEIPASNIRQIQQALPFVVEELIAEDIESVHIATEAKLDTKAASYDIAVIKHEILINILDVFAKCRLKPKVLLPEVHLLPYQTQSLSVLVDKQQILLRWGDYSGSSVAVSHSGMLSQLLSDTLSQQHIQHLQLITFDASDDEAIESIKRQFEHFVVQETSFKNTVSELLAEKVASNAYPVINLLQGGYNSETKPRLLDAQGFKVFQSAAVVLAVYLATALGSGLYFDYQAAQVQAESKDFYRKLFPGERRVINPKRQMLTHVGRAGGSSSGSQFLSLLGHVAEKWNHNGVVPELNQLRYNIDRNQLQVELKAESIAQLDQFKQRLLSGGVQAEINSANEQDNGVVGRVNIGAL